MTAVPAFSLMKLLRRRKLVKVRQCVHAALPCSGEFACVHIYHPITAPILMEAAISCARGQACRRGECDESTGRRNITLTSLNERID